MKSRAAAKGSRLLLLAAVCIVSAILLSPTAEASRGGLPAAYEPALAAPATPDQVLESELSDPPERLRLFDDLSLPPRPLELVEASKTASGSSTFGLGLNIRQTWSLSRESGGLSFQGLWTDPVTGIAYARNRWYDARTASWLSEDPKGAIDSPNLYAAFALAPHVFTDPMGSNVESAEVPCTMIEIGCNPTTGTKHVDYKGHLDQPIQPAYNPAAEETSLFQSIAPVVSRDRADIDRAGLLVEVVPEIRVSPPTSRTLKSYRS